MLNYIWVGLIVVGVLVAAGNDIADDLRNTYRNGTVLDGALEVQKPPTALRQTWEGDLVVAAPAFAAFYGVGVPPADVRVPVSVMTAPDGKSAMQLTVADGAPPRWKEMARAASGKERLAAELQSIRFAEDGRSAAVRIVLEPVRFVKMRAVTAAALDYAATAVNIALGLIGVMALWLGVMKVAEEAGLLKILTRLLAPVTRRVFPDVPADHPAIGAIIMNTAANMLGLSNAATPMGLKAMEELNKLNPKVGTATNAMVTFLAINTGGLVLIPATAIAVRAAAGSMNPGLIIGTSIVGAGCATVTGVVASRLLQRLPRYRKAMEVDHG
jgi:spore maturation protein A